MSRPAIVSAFLLLGCATTAPARPVAAVERAEDEPPLPPSDATQVLEQSLEDSLPRDAWTPPISGGTLLITADGERVVASDPDRNRVWLLDVSEVPPSVDGFVAMQGGDEPGRLAEGPDGSIFVALRRGGAVASVDPGGVTLRWRASVCPAPRGISAQDDVVHVACAGGELATLDAGTGETLALRSVGADLRDVGVVDGRLWVSRFRAADWAHVDDPTSHTVPPENLPAPGFANGTEEVVHGDYGAGVAWRTFSDGDSVTMVHQRAWMGDLTDEIVGSAEYYGHGAVKAAVTRWEDGELRWSRWFPGILPVDAAPLADGQVAVVLAGSDGVRVLGDSGGMTMVPLGSGDRQPSAVAFHEDVGLVVQTRDTPGVSIYRETDVRGLRRFSRGLSVRLGDFLFFERPVGDRVFHQPSRGIACASCHPEGGDDGHVWRLEGEPRRTQSLRGGVLSKSAFHWQGDLPTFTALINNTWVRRMGGRPLHSDQVRQLGRWLHQVPDLGAPSGADPDAVARGRAIFEDPRVACASCHRGDRFTDGRVHDVGTGGGFMTPALVGIAARGPYLHDGCADTLEDRLGQCHTPGHGRVRHLSPEQREDLVAYMRSL